MKITYRDEKTGELKISRVPQSDASIKNRGDYIDRFEEIQTGRLEEIRASQYTVYQAPGISFYIELLGKGFYSLNVDYRKNKTAAMALGIQWVENAFFTSFMYYRFHGKKYSTEIGGGISSVVTDDGLMGIFINGVYGYRFQKKNGLLFRIGFTPLIGIPFANKGRFVIMPWAGISFGYSL